jgi:recombination protein RecA
MAKRKETNNVTVPDVAHDFTKDLIKSLNKDFGDRVAYNLSTDISPTHVKRWVSTGCRSLDYIVSNRKNGGLPEGRIIEIFGPPSIGKSHIATQIACSTQKMGGIVVYIDTENATSVENLHMLGVDVSKRFVYIDTHCTEEVFKVAESTILKVKAMEKDVPVTIIWDSVAGTSPKAELDGDYDKDTIGLQARTISKGMRKITGVIGDQSILFVCLNQIRDKIGVLYGDPTTTPGGKAIPFHSSVRIKLGAGSQIVDKSTGDVIGINVSAKTIKNKISPPFRSCNFQIHFGKGIFEDEELFDAISQAVKKIGPFVINGKNVDVSGGGAWKTFIVTDENTGEVLVDKKFYKKDFCKLYQDPESAELLELLTEQIFVKKMSSSDSIDIDPESYIEIESLANTASDLMSDLDDPDPEQA